MSLRHRARPLSTQTRGPYSVRPWSCYCKKRPCFIKLPEGRRTHQPPPQRTSKVAALRKEISDSAYVGASSRWVGYLSPAAWIKQGCCSSSSSRDGRSTVHASAWTRWRARRRGEIPHPPRRREPQRLRNNLPHSTHPNDRVTAFCHAEYNRPRCSLLIPGRHVCETPQLRRKSSVLFQ